MCVCLCFNAYSNTWTAFTNVSVCVLMHIVIHGRPLRVCLCFNAYSNTWTAFTGVSVF